MSRSACFWRRVANEAARLVSSPHSGLNLNGERIGDRRCGRLPRCDLFDADRLRCAPLSSQQWLPVLFVEQLVQQVDDAFLVTGAIPPVG